MPKRLKRSRKLKVYFTYPYLSPKLRRNVVKIRRILKRNYTVIEYPRSKRLVQKNVYDALKQSIEPADIALAYFPTMAGMPPLAVMTEIMIALGMNKKVIAVGSRAVRKNLGRLFSDAFSRAFESPEDLMKAKSLA